jgi:hypothetical protein
MRSEERRALVLLGITAVLASILGTMYGLIWTGAKKLEAFYFNVPCDSAPHVTVYVVPVVEQLIKAWVAYAVFAFVYFSEDWLRTPRRILIRTISHYFATLSMGFYFIYLISYIPAFYHIPHEHEKHWHDGNGHSHVRGLTSRTRLNSTSREWGLILVIG